MGVPGSAGFHSFYHGPRIASCYSLGRDMAQYLTAVYAALAPFFHHRHIGAFHRNVLHAIIGLSAQRTRICLIFGRFPLALVSAMADVIAQELNVSASILHCLECHSLLQDPWYQDNLA